MFGFTEGQRHSDLSMRTIMIAASAVLLALCLLFIMNGSGEADAADGDTFTEINDYTVISEAGKTVELSDFKVVFDSSDTAKEYTFPATVTHNGTEYKVTKIGKGAFDNKDVRSIILPDGINIGEIKDYYFSNCTSAERIELGNSVTYVEPGSFMNCSSLKTIVFGTSVGNITYKTVEMGTDWKGEKISILTNIEVAPGNNDYSSDGGVLYNKDKSSLVVYPSGVKYFNENKEFPVYNDFTVPDSVKRIEMGAFYDCDMRDVTIGAGVEYIDLTAFADTFVKRFIVAPENAKYSSPDNMLIDKVGNVFMRCAVGLAVNDPGQPGKETYTVPDGINTIAPKAFRHALGYNSITLPASVTIIGVSGFESCSELTAINLAGIKIIGDFAFRYCGKLAIGVPDTVENIGSYAFAESGITSVSIGAATTMVDTAFRQCPAIVSFTVDPGNTIYKAVDGVLMTKNGGQFICYPAGSAATSYEVPMGTFNICQYAFANAKNLKSVTIPRSVYSISDHAFVGCSLDTLSLSEGLNEIGSYALDGAFTFKDLTLPESVRKIGEAIVGMDTFGKTIHVGKYVTDIGQYNINPKYEVNLVISSENPKYYIDQSGFSLKIKQYTVIFKDNTDVIKRDVLDYGTLIVAPEYAQPGFKEWDGFREGHTWVNGDVTFYALYEEKKEYSITAPEYIVPDVTKALPGTTVLVNINAPEGRYITGISLVDATGTELVVLKENKQYRFVMPYHDVELRYAKMGNEIYNITTISSNLTIEPQKQEFGKEVVVTITGPIPEGHRSVIYGLPEGYTVEGNVYRFSMPARNVDLRHDFVSNNFTISHDAGITVAETAVYGQVVEFTVDTPADKTAVPAITDVNITKISPNRFSFSMPLHDVHISVSFVDRQYNIEHSSLVTVKDTAVKGETVRFTVSDVEGKNVTPSIDGVQLNHNTDGSYSFTMPGSDVMIVTTQEDIFYNITGDESITVKSTAVFHEKVSFSVDAPKGKTAVPSIEGVEVLPSSTGFSFEMPSHDVDITVVFNDVQYTITHPEDVTVADTAVYNQTVEFTVPYEGRDVTVSIADVPVRDLGSGKYSFVMPDRSITIDVVSEWIDYTVTVSGNVNVSKDTARFGDSVSITSREGSSIVSLDAEGVEFTVVTAGSSYTFTMPAKNVAVFAKTVADGIPSVKEGDTTSFTSESDNSANIPFAEAKTQSDNVKVTLSSGSVLLDKNALNSVDGAQTVVIAVVGSSALEPDMAELVGDRPVMEVSVGDIHDFGNGKITITLGYVLKAGESGDALIIWHFLQDGTVEKVPCTYDAVKEEVTFQVSSLSNFAIMENKYDVTVSGNTGGTVTVSPSSGVIPGTTVTLTVTVDDGHYVTGAAATGGIDVGSMMTQGGTMTFVMPDEDVDIEITFAALEPEPGPSGGDDGGDGNSMGLIIGAAVAVIAVIAVAVFFLMKRKA